MIQCSIRELILGMTLAAVVVAWAADRTRLSNGIARLRNEASTLYEKDCKIRNEIFERTGHSVGATG
jgi:hypothetical protein